MHPNVAVIPVFVPLFASIMTPACICGVLLGDVDACIVMWPIF